ncbi:MAG: hypothetical protein EA415_00210 [Sphaerobacteraceae bacterium]|nr:MAG: hypothetical protein EA415_00210 [Sphaerobacteraceae bacterium]
MKVTQTPARSGDGAPNPLREYSLFNALLGRRSRRLGKGFRLNGGPLAYESPEETTPLAIEEEAALAFAACGITGYTTADVPFQAGDMPGAGGGNILAHFAGRTVPSADSMHNVTMFVINDDGTWLLRRPQDYPRMEIGELARAARRGDLVDLYRRSRIKLADHRVNVPREFPYMLPFNLWAGNVPGSTYFLPVTETSGLIINALLAAFDDEWAAYFLDDRNGFRSPGLAGFARSKGGHLYDDPRDNRMVPIGVFESSMYELMAAETGAMIQNLGLMAQALGIGGFTHYAGHPQGWLQALGFQMQAVPTSRVAGMGRLMSLLLRVLRRDDPLPTAVGLQGEGQTLLKPWCPPHFPDMEHAVRAFIDYKFAPGSGTLRDGGAATAWRDGYTVQQGIPAPSEKAIAATVSYCDYVYRRYGRFPSANGPFRTTIAYQAHNLDTAFYERFYEQETLDDIRTPEIDPS